MADDTSLLGDATTATPAAATGETTTTATAPAVDTQPPADKAEGTTTTEPKDQAITKSDGKPEGAKAEPAEIEVKLPDGVTADEVLLGEFKPIAKELGLKSEHAQKLVDLAVKMQTQTAEKWKQDVQERQAKWKAEVVADKELGGKDLEEKLATVREAIAKFGGKELHKELNDLGLGNHPGILRAFYRAGLAIKDDSVAGRMTNSTPKSPKDAVRERYPNTPEFHRD